MIVDEEEEVGIGTSVLEHLVGRGLKQVDVGVSVDRRRWGRKLTVYASLLVDIVCQGCNHNTFPRGSQDRVEEIL